MPGTEEVQGAQAPAGPAARSLGQRTFTGLVWTLSQNGISRLITLGSQLLIAKFLSPTDFGLVGLAYSVQMMIISLISFGIDDVIVQRGRTARLWLGTGMVVSMSFACIAAIAMIVAAPFVAQAYHAPPLTGMLILMAATLPIGWISSMPAVLLRLDLRFGLISAYLLIEMIAQTVLTVILAWLKFGAYSFIIPVPIFNLIRAMVYWYAAKPPILLRRTFLRRWRLLAGRGMLNWTTKLTNTTINQGDYFLLGLFVTKVEVGLYYFAFRIAAQPVWILAGNLTQVITPALSQFRSDPIRQGQAAMRGARLLAFTIMPIAFLQATVAAPLLTWAFGTKWNGAIPYIAILSIGIAFDAVSWIAGALLTARGQYKALFRMVVVQVPVFFLLIGVGCYWQRGLGVAAGVALFYILTQPIFVYRIFRPCGCSLGETLWLYVGPTLGAALASALALAAASLSPVKQVPLLQLAVIGIVTSVAYLLFMKIAAPDVLDQLIGRFRAFFAKRAARNQRAAAATGGTVP